MILVEGREEPPNCNDTTELPGGGRLGKFWTDCKSRRKCATPPYDQLSVISDLL